MLAEAKRSFTYLNLFGFNTDAIIVNRVRRMRQGRILRALAGHSKEIRGRNRIELSAASDSEGAYDAKGSYRTPILEELADIVYGEQVPSAMLYRGRTETIREEDGDMSLELSIPFVEKANLDLTQTGDELTVDAGAYKRKVILPRTLMGREVIGAKYAKDRLIIRFGKRELTAQGKVEDQ